MSVSGIQAQLANIGSVGGANSTSMPSTQPVGKSGPSFQQTLDALSKPGLGTTPTQSSNTLKFSSHAVERMRTRGVQLGPEKMDQINNAVEKARTKGAKETLVLTDNAALIVSVKNNTVVTVMDSQALKDNVFTNIDSTVVI